MPPENTGETKSDIEVPTPPPITEEAFDDNALAKELASLDRDESPTTEDSKAEEVESKSDAPEEPQKDEGDEPANDNEVTEESEGEEGDNPADEGSPDDEGAEPSEETDPETLKRFEMIAKREKRAAEKLAKKEVEITEKLKELEEGNKELRAYQEARERAKYDPAAVLEALGLSEEDFEPAARALYARSKDAAENPKLKEAASRTMRERELYDRVEKAEKALENLQTQIRDEKQTAENEQKVSKFMGDVEKSVDESSAPLVHRLISNLPDKARNQLRQVAEYMVHRDEEVPDPKDVVRELEKIRRNELSELGIEYPSKKKETKPEPATEKPMAKTLSSETGTTKPRSEPLGDEDIDAQIIKELREMG